MKDKDIDNFFNKEKISLNSDFTNDILNIVKFEDRLLEPKVSLNKDFYGDLMKKIKSQNRIKRFYRYIALTSSLAASLFVGLFAYYSLNNKSIWSSKLSTDSQMEMLVKNNIESEVDYLLKDRDIRKLEEEIDMLNVSILEMQVDMFSNLQ